MFRHQGFAALIGIASWTVGPLGCGTGSSTGAGPNDRGTVADGSGSGGDGASSGSSGSAGAGLGGDDGAAPEDAALNSWFDGNAPPLGANVTLHIAGDSTASIFPSTDPRVGWGAVFQQFFASASGVTVDDAARSGRSSKSFIDEGLWAALKATIRPGDYVFIEFGHNDEKVGTAALYTDPATTFRDYLKTYVADTRAAGGFPVLLTPTSRRQFSGTSIVPTHGAYPAAVIAVAAQTATPVIDMTEKTRVWLEGLGPTASIPMFAPSDNTHTSAQGAPQVGQLVVEGIRELGLPLTSRLN